MAILKASGGGHGGKSLYRVIKYITRDDKTSTDLIGGCNVDPDNAYEEMTATKRQWKKISGRAYKHFIYSFAPSDGITPREALAAAAELIEKSEMFRDFEVLYAVHTDQDHIHAHIIVNSVSILDGHKFRYPKKALDDLKTLSNAIAAEHGYCTDQNIETNNVTAWNRELYKVLEDAHEGKVSSWMYDTAKAVQAAMAAADRDAFINELEAQGYVVRWGNRFVTYVTPSGKKVRASRLEEIFKLPSIRVRYADREEEQELLRRDLVFAGEQVQRTEISDYRSDKCTDIDGAIYAQNTPRHSPGNADNATGSSAETMKTAEQPVPHREPYVELESSVQISIYKDPRSSMSDDELRAAALIYGQALFSNGTIRDYMAANGYAMSNYNGATYLYTPRGYTLEIMSALDDAKVHGLETIGCVSVSSSGWMEEKTKCISTLNSTDIAALAADALTDAADPVDVLAHLIGEGVRIQRKDCVGKTDYELISESDRIMLSEVVRSLGIEAELTADLPLPAGDYDGKAADDKSAYEPIEAYETPASKAPAISDQDNLADLLNAVQKASVAADRDTFVDELESLGYRTRWTDGGTLTFITQGGQHIRASRLEKRFKLPSIAAAYGQDRRVPVQGARYDAAQIIRHAMAESDNRQEFDSILISAGYAIEWKADESDATITVPGGQRMRLSSLDRTFGLSESIREEEINGVQSAAAESTEINRNAGLEELRSAIYAARSCVAPDAADRADTAAAGAYRRTRGSYRAAGNGNRESNRNSYERDGGTQKKDCRSSMER